MGAESNENLDDLFLGHVSEGVSESDEVFADRVRQAQAKMAQIQKDEKSAHQYDLELSKIIGDLSPLLLEMVILCIDHEVPSLTILAIIALLNPESGKICWEVFSAHVEEKADFSGAGLSPPLEAKISYWWTFIHGADHLSKTIKLRSLKADKDFTKKFTQNLGQILSTFLEKNQSEALDLAVLKKRFEGLQKEVLG